MLSDAISPADRSDINKCVVLLEAELIIFLNTSCCYIPLSIINILHVFKISVMAPAVDHTFTNGHVHINGARRHCPGDGYSDRATETADVSAPFETSL